MAATVNPAGRQTDSGYKALVKAGWKRNCDVSPGGHLCIPVQGAPSLGGSRGGLLYFGTYTAPDGTTLISRSNMERSPDGRSTTVTVIIIDPSGKLIEFFIADNLTDSAERIDALGLV